MDRMMLYIFLYGLLLLLAGYFLPFIQRRSLARSISWMLALVTVLASLLMTAHAGSLFRMIVIVVLQLVSMKILVAVETYSGQHKLTFAQWAAFALGWFGMRPVLFENLPSPALPYRYFVLKGLSRIVLGFILLYLSRVTEHYYGEVFFLSDLLLLAGLSLIVHVGILNVSTAFWRLLGVNAPELFRSPYKSKSLREFWGRRWNIAFSEMTALIAYRPLKAKIGADKALGISFLLSGVLHEIAISFPVKSGYGLPMLYFGIHAVFMHLEEKSAMLKRITNHAVMARVWVLTCPLLPMPLLFHHQFIHGVLMPLRSLMLSAT